jgi:hypothetical protein
MSEESKVEEGTLFKRVPVILRSWDGPNSRIGLEVDLGQIPWGPFDALGKRLSLLLPVTAESPTSPAAGESQVERALRHVEHAADRCGEFAQLANGNQDLWLRSQETWEWVRKYLTSLWVETEVDGRVPTPATASPSRPPLGEPEVPRGPTLPGAAATLRVAARALRSTPLAVWRETLDILDPDAPTREEAVQTLLGVAKILSGEGRGSEDLDSRARGGGPPEVVEAPTSSDPPAEEAPHPQEKDPDQVSFDFARGYDEGYRMGRRVGLALGAARKPGSGPERE